MKALSLLIKPASSSCNLRCKYCFYFDLADIREVKNYGIMTQDCASALVQKACETGADDITIAFQGGEPLIAGLEFYKSFVSLVAKFNTKKARISYSIQTNGLLLDKEWSLFFKENNFLLGLSLDGYRELHDFNRCESYNTVANSVRVLQEYNVDFNILTVVTDLTAKHIVKVYNHFKKLGVRYLQFIPCLPKFNDADKEKPLLSGQKYGDFLKTLFDLWLFDYKKGDYISIRHIDNYVRMLTGQIPETCAMSGRCGEYYVIEADGSLYPCDFYSVDDYRLKNIFDDNPFVLTDKHKTFLLDSEKLNDACKSCDYYFICRGGCRRDREQALTINRYCKAYKSFFDHALKDLREVAVVFMRQH